VMGIDDLVALLELADERYVVLEVGLYRFL
jgi:hypothetical protein